MSNQINQQQDYIKTICVKKHTQFPVKANVWAGILWNHIDGPLFFNAHLLYEEYHGRWTSIESSDLTLLDFFCRSTWNISFTPQHLTVLTFSKQIVEECRAISADIRVGQDFSKRMHYCQEQDGAHFE